MWGHHTVYVRSLTGSESFAVCLHLILLRGHQFPTTHGTEVQACLVSRAVVRGAALARGKYSCLSARAYLRWGARLEVQLEFVRTAPRRVARFPVTIGAAEFWACVWCLAVCWSTRTYVRAHTYVTAHIWLQDFAHTKCLSCVRQANANVHTDNETNICRRTADDIAICGIMYGHKNTRAHGHTLAHAQMHRCTNLCSRHSHRSKMFLTGPTGNRT